MKKEIIAFIIEATKRLEKDATEEELKEIQEAVGKIWRKYHKIEEIYNE